MTSNEDTSTRTIASVAAVVAILALGLGLTESARSGVIAQFAGTANAVSQNNDVTIMEKMDALNARIDTMEKSAAAAPAADAPAADAPAADAPVADAPAGD